MNQSSGVIGMEMRQHNLAYVSGCDSESPKLRTNLFFRMDRKADRTPVERMPGGMVSVLMNPRGLPRIDHDHSLIMLDDPGVDRQPLRPVFVKQHVRYPGRPRASRFHLWTSHLHQSSANCVNFRHMHPSLKLTVFDEYPAW